MLEVGFKTAQCLTLACFSDKMELCVAAVFLSYFAPALGSAFGREMPASNMDEIHEYDKPFHYGRKCRCKGKKSKPVGLDTEAARGAK
ncbi:uncharacterized protein LOC127497909 isoform X5 [Ctenopharyngodon idella]|uniref:uncharacterized protein LOC127497909 isoform X5 n=1 Tax=Ctenopharyngodon idella TaxID=7959 RepID=UPI00222F8783|nr:uncharacterized protein LOC127497909 isoform X5 [Ctenopharyngodon idella]